MSDDIDFKKSDLIQAAMNRVRGDTTRVDRDFTDSRTMVHRREQDQALKHRLDQLEIARGSNTLAGSASTVAVGPTEVHSTAINRPASGWGPLLLTALVSALGGAGLTWWMLVGQTGQPTQLAVAVPVAALPGSGASSAAVAASSVSSPVTMENSGLAAQATAVDDDLAQALDLIEGWRQAWERRDVDGYLAYYSDHFSPSNGQTRDAWRMARQKNLSSRASIKVGINGVRTDRMGVDRIKVTFLQDYASGKYEERAQPKTLLVQRQGKSWQIVGEWQGDKKG